MQLKMPCHKVLCKLQRAIFWWLTVDGPPPPPPRGDGQGGGWTRGGVEGTCKPAARVWKFCAWRRGCKYIVHSAWIVQYEGFVQRVVN